MSALLKTAALPNPDSAETPARVFRRRALEWADLPAHRVKRRGVWLTTSWRDYYARVRACGLALLKLGLRRGDVTTIHSENRPEWLYADLGAQGIGCIGNGIYPTASAEQVAFILGDSRTRALFVENEEQLDKALAVRERCPTLEKIVVFDMKGLRGFSDPGVISFESLLAIGEVASIENPGLFDDAIDGGAPDDIAFLVYTSGTTGAPKGAMMANRNVAYQMSRAADFNFAGAHLKTLSFLPLCHIAERMATTFSQLALGNIVHFPESPGTVFNDLREVAPERVFAPPRFWEKLYSQVDLFMQDAVAPAQAVYRYAFAEGRALAAVTNASPLRKARFALLDRIAMSNVRKFLGLQNVRNALVGAAPVSPELIAWFSAIGVNLVEAFGMTETCGACTVPHHGRAKAGWAGSPLSGTEIRIGPDDELLVRGPGVFAGYWSNLEKTREAFTADGWFRTGDCAEISPDGYMRVKDRLKDVIITSGGKNVTPSVIENNLKFSPYISDAMVVGDGRKYLSCLVMIDIDSVAKYAQSRQVPFTDFASLTRAPEVIALVRAEVEGVNAKLARVEQIKDFRIIDQLLTADDEELTPTMKLKRRVVAAKYAGLIAEMYAN